MAQSKKSGPHPAIPEWKVEKMIEKAGYIQVTSKDVQKMHELGYKQMPVDEYGNGQWCFVPKTYLPVFKTAGQRREDGDGDVD